MRVYEVDCPTEAEARAFLHGFRMAGAIECKPQEILIERLITSKTEVPVLRFVIRMLDTNDFVVGDDLLEDHNKWVVIDCKRL